MAQAGRARKLRAPRKGQSQAMLEARTRTGVEAAIRRGVVEGAEAVECEVCGRPSEGWAIEGGKITWHHFGRIANCARRMEHIDSGLPQVWE